MQRVPGAAQAAVLTHADPAVAAAAVPPGQSVVALPMRLACVAATAAVVLAWGTAPATFVWVTYSIGFGHYFLALRYSTNQLRQIAETPQRMVALVGLLLLSVALYRYELTFVVYFGIHHALNEAYSRRGGETARLPAFGASAFVLQALAYVAMLGWNPRFIGLDPAWLWVGFAAATGPYIYGVLRLRGESATASLFEICAPEISAAAMVALSLFVPLTFIQIVLYHFLLWTVLPLPRIRQRHGNALGEYVGLSVVAIGVALLLSPLGPSSIRLGSEVFAQQFFFWSYLHITLSFGLSDAHPAWIVRLCRGSAPGKATPLVGASYPGAAA